MDSRWKSYTHQKDEEEELRSLPLMPIFYSVPSEGGEGDVWHLTSAVVSRNRQGDLSTIASSDDLTSLETASQNTDTGTVRSGRSSFSSTGSLDSVAQSSQPTTPQESPVSTPVPRRKVRTALKLNIADSTWRRSRERRSSKRSRMKQNLHARSTRVIAVVQKSKKPEFRFKVVLLALFCCIVVLVAYGRHEYEKRKRQLVMKNIKFHELDKKFSLLKNEKVIIESSLGTEIPNDLHPYNCKKTYDSAICLEWMYRARLRIKKIHDDVNITCYDFHWDSLNPETKLKDCIDMSQSNWYGIGNTKKITWPLIGFSGESKPFVTGDAVKGSFGSVLQRYWLSSKGVAIRTQPDIPLYVSINNSGNENLCLEAKYDGFPYYHRDGALPQLHYMICVAPSINLVHQGILKKYYKFPENTTNMETYINNTIWFPSPKLGVPLSHESIIKYASKNLEHFQEFINNFMLIDIKWQAKYGDLAFKESFGELHAFFTLLHMKTFKVLLSIHPYICLESSSFIRWSDEQYFISDSQNRAPLLTRWQNKLCAIIDFTKDSSAKWFLTRLEKLKSNYGITGFFFTGGLTSFHPRNYKFHQFFVNPDHFIHRYLNHAKEISQIMGTDIGFETENIPAYISLLPRTCTWDSHTGLRSIIPSVLTLSLMGYSVINPGSIGGDIPIGTNGTCLDRELYLRWMQLAIFMPVVQFSIHPADFDEVVVKIAKTLLQKRKDEVLPVMKNALKESLATGVPLIRPLWWLAPHDYNAHRIDSEFVIGDKIIVAPILEAAKTIRDVYLPPGMWQDNCGRIQRGGKWMHNYIADLQEVPYFIKQ
ncbi:myogenesis-regulating glycosidase-like [Centruroides sculpturatus]|uniref:myogenesis-regulating glycosidase-like n=1 Tax=Centruroides sculpturatus TaxID=218467 RepID=UPI000C6D8860|nr:myogenesis-regulating glycosidase-like [Centruroides sculpturatus]